jgi:hypothetical protein
MSKFTRINLYSGLRRAYVLTFLLLMEEIEAHGTDHALEMLQRVVEKQADIVAREFKGCIPEDLRPLDIGLEVYRRFMADAGADIEIYNRDEISVTVMVKRCPFFEALLDLGVDCGYFLGGLCSNLTLPSVQAILVRFDPRLRLEAETVRESMEGLCLERIYLHVDE